MLHVCALSLLVQHNLKAWRSRVNSNRTVLDPIHQKEKETSLIPLRLELPDLMAVRRSIRLRPLRLSLQLLLDLHKLVDSVVLQKLGPLVLGERQDRQPTDSSVTPGLLEVILGPRDPSCDERPVGLGGETLKTGHLGQRSSRGLVEQVGGSVVKLGEGVGVDVAQTHDGTVGLASEDGREHEVGKST